MSDAKKPLRSTAWFGHPDRDGFLHRSWMKNQGFPADLFDGRPVIGICNTFSELTPCNAHLRELAERVKRGVYEAGGFPLEFPVFSTGEVEPQADRDAVPQPRLDGRRGGDPRQSDRRRRADDRLRQDHARAPDGRRVLRRAGDRALGRADAERQVPGHRHRLRHRRLALRRGGQGRRDEPRGFHGRRGVHVALGRPLHGDGHRLDHEQHGRGARHEPAGLRRDSRGRQPAPRDLAADRAADRRDGQGGPAHLEDPAARELPECGPRQRRARRLDQRGDPPARDRRPARGRLRASTTGSATATRCRRWSTSCRPGAS